MIYWCGHVDKDTREPLQRRVSAHLKCVRWSPVLRCISNPKCKLWVSPNKLNGQKINQHVYKEQLVIASPCCCSQGPEHFLALKIINVLDTWPDSTWFIYILYIDKPWTDLMAMTTKRVYFEWTKKKVIPAYLPEAVQWRGIYEIKRMDCWKWMNTVSWNQY